MMTYSISGLIFDENDKLVSIGDDSSATKTILIGRGVYAFRNEDNTVRVFELKDSKVAHIDLPYRALIEKLPYSEVYTCKDTKYMYKAGRIICHRGDDEIVIYNWIRLSILEIFTQWR